MYNDRFILYIVTGDVKRLPGGMGIPTGDSAKLSHERGIRFYFSGLLRLRTGAVDTRMAEITPNQRRRSTRMVVDWTCDELRVIHYV
jgi:hypothetical protein